MTLSYIRCLLLGRNRTGDEIRIVPRSKVQFCIQWLVISSHDNRRILAAVALVGTPPCRERIQVGSFGVEYDPWGFLPLAHNI